MIAIGMAREYPPKLPEVEPAPVSRDEIPDYVRAAYSAFHNHPREHLHERWQRVLEPERTLVLRDRGRIVAGAGIFSRRLTVPGGEVPAAGVTLVAVRPTHRRRGLLTVLMRRQLADIHDAGREPVAALWASEPVIYGRFGYGLATLAADLEVRTREARLRRTSTAQVDLLGPADALDAMRPVHEAVRPELPGMLDRDGPWWEDRLRDHESDRDGAQPLLAAVTEDAYALYTVKPWFAPEGPAGEVRVREVVAASDEGLAAIWGFLLGLDLITKLMWDLAAADEPLPHMVVNAHDVRVHLADALWVRLVDLPRALAARTYAQPFEVVFEVVDDVCPWNAGRWALRWDGSTATCARTATPAALELGAAELGAVYLGGTTLEQLARAGRVCELRSGALAAASRAFMGDRAPWCPEIF
jgi:predicted acetyltransferase